MFTDLRARIGEREPTGRGDYSSDRVSMEAATHYRLCRNLLEHTVSAENLNHRFRREIGNSLTWHDGRGHRATGGRVIKLLKQPGTEVSQVELYLDSMQRSCSVWVSPTSLSGRKFYSRFYSCKCEKRSAICSCSVKLHLGTSLRGEFFRHCDCYKIGMQEIFKYFFLVPEY
ncbi:sterile alpha motif domain-containing protein 10 isoform X3 [Mixophyes fleayi]|uniref:sterile alpha motif domain-containing protein 10 isoform X3 n=1 Tax=Mixophyes fleayi TaxID=3061075 RepID=UPI003F4D7251